MAGSSLTRHRHRCGGCFRGFFDSRLSDYKEKRGNVKLSVSMGIVTDVLFINASNLSLAMLEFLDMDFGDISKSESDR